MSAAPQRSLWIVDPSLETAEDEGAAELEQRWGGPSRRFLPALRPGDGPTPETGYDCAGVVLMGSAASVHDARPWLPPLAAWLAPLLDGRRALPLLGICFGHQLVAHLAGGSIGWLEPETRSKRVGVETSTLTGGPFGREPLAARVIVSHREVVTSVPDGYDVIGTRAGVAIDALAHRSLPILTYQFHPEARAEFAARAGIPVESLDRSLVEQSRRTIDAFMTRARVSRVG